jgi:hypothetical protein
MDRTDDAETITGTRAPRHGRVLAFRILAGFFGVVLIATNTAFALGSLTDDAQKVHSFHNLGPFFVYTLLMGVPLLVLAFRPTDVVALRVAWAVAIGTVIASLMGEDTISGSYLIVPIVLLVLTALAPMRGELLRFGSPNIAMLCLAILAAIPAIVYAWDNARKMIGVDPATDVTGHWKNHHWSGVAGVALGLVLAAAVVAFRRPGDRLWVWMVGLAAMFFGLMGVVYADTLRYPSSLGTGWGVVAMFAGLVYIVVGEVSARREPIT